MDRPLIEFVLPESKITAFIAESLTYGEQSDLNAVMLSGTKTPVGELANFQMGEIDMAVLMEYQIQVVTTMVKRLVLPSGDENQVTRDTVRELSAKDGEALVTKCLSVMTEKKS